MTYLALELQEVRGPHLTIYADDTSLWTIEGPVKYQKAILQKALNMTQAFMDKTGMRISTEKTTYVAISNSTGRKEKAAYRILLTIGGHRIVKQNCVKVLGIWVRQTLETDARHNAKTHSQEVGGERRYTENLGESLPSLPGNVRFQLPSAYKVREGSFGKA